MLKYMSLLRDYKNRTFYKLPIFFLTNYMFSSFPHFTPNNIGKSIFYSENIKKFLF
jgi:hypothetical protein